MTHDELCVASVWAGQRERIRREADRHSVVQQGTVVLSRDLRSASKCHYRNWLWNVLILRAWTFRRWQWNLVLVEVPRPPSLSCPSSVRSQMHHAGLSLSACLPVPPSRNGHRAKYLFDSVKGKMQLGEHKVTLNTFAVSAWGTGGSHDQHLPINHNLVVPHWIYSTVVDTG